MEFVDPRTTPFVDICSRGELPHLYKPGGHYFVTFRLFDAVIPRKIQKLKQPLDWIALADEYDPPITLGSCVLRRPDVARLMHDALLAGHGQRYDLSAWCVMPNHVHAVFAPLVEVKLSGILQSWKGATARWMNQLLGRQGTLWERESFDHLIRNADSFARFVRYVEENPVAAGLCERPEAWPFCSASISIPSR